MGVNSKPIIRFSLNRISQSIALMSLVSASAVAVAAPEMLGNPNFSNGTTGWWSSGAELTVKDGEACMDIKRAGSNPWDVILGQRGFGLEKGQEYSVDFVARADKNTAATALIQHNGAPYTQYFNKQVKVGPEPKAFSFTFTQEQANDAKTEFQFQLGAQKKAVLCFSDISVKGESFVVVNKIPTIRLNQVGFFPKSEKIAVIQSESKQPRVWRVKDEQGNYLLAGKTKVFGKNAASGEMVHQADFSALTDQHQNLVLEVDGKTSHPFRIADDIYSELKHDALGYFYQNRSGIEIKEKYVQRPDLARPAGHAPDKVTCFDKTDDKGNDWPGCDFTMDVTGGWYDAGDHGKYVVNGGISTWTLMNLYERSQYIEGAKEPFPDGDQAIPEAGNGINDLLDETRWNMEFMMSMQIPKGSKVFAPVGNQRENMSNLKLTEIDASGMAFHKVADENWTGMPLPPHKDPMTRYVGQPSTAATLNLAATGAQCARIWKDIDADFAAQCLDAAKRAWKAANQHPEVYAYNNFTGSGPYDDVELADEFYWAAAELFITTEQAEYFDYIKASPFFLTAPVGDETAKGDLWWAGLSPAGNLSLALVPSPLDEASRAKVRANIVAAADGYYKQLANEGYHIPYTAEQYPWGSNSNLVKRGIFLTYASDYSGDSKYMQALVHAMDYILGRNPLDQSYITGYGSNPLKNPHHRFWAHQADPKSPVPAPGAMSGGPNSMSFSDPIAAGLKGNCIGQTCFVDDIGAWTLNEITINWNAPLVWAVTALDEHRMK